MAFIVSPISGIPLYASSHPSTGGNTELIKNNDGGVLSDCMGFVDVVSSFVPTKMSTYGFSAEHNDDGEIFYGLAIIDYELSPLKQSQAGIHAQDVWHKESLFLMLKNDNTKPIFDNYPACVFKDIVEKLIERNYGYAPPESQIYRYLGNK